jgi:hypothetical protein
LRHLRGAPGSSDHRRNCRTIFRTRDRTPSSRSSCHRNVAACRGTWADQIRVRHPETAPWHYVSIPVHVRAGEATGYDAARDCPNKCIVAKIEQFERVLADRQASDILLAMSTSHSTLPTTTPRSYRGRRSTPSIASTKRTAISRVDTAFEDGLKMAWQHARQGVQCEDWQHERAGTEPLVCSRPPASLTKCACQADAQERPTQWKTGDTVKLARLTHS